MGFHGNLDLAIGNLEPEDKELFGAAMKFINLSSTADSVVYTTTVSNDEIDYWTRSWNTLKDTYTGSFSYSFTPTLDWVLIMEDSKWFRSEKELLNRFHNLSFWKIPSDELTYADIIDKTNHMLHIWLFNLTRRSPLPSGMYAEDFIRVLDDIEGEHQEIHEDSSSKLCSCLVPNAIAWERYRQEAIDAGVDYQVEAYLAGTPFEMIEANWRAV